MKFVDMLANAQAKNNSMLCVGLDPDLNRLPAHLGGDIVKRVYYFCEGIANATYNQACCFKLQIAYFAACGAEDALQKIIEYIHKYTSLPVILDAKRGDIGPTAEMYAREAFVRYKADAVTLSPFLGLDSILPFMADEYASKGIFLLCRTSNEGGADLQALRMFSERCGGPGDMLYEYIAKLANGPWNKTGNLGLVVGATQPRELARVRDLAPTLPLLLPDIGAQGGDILAAITAGYRPGGPVIVNSSRQILYASAGEYFAQRAARVAKDTREALNNARLTLEVAKGSQF